MLEQRPVIRSKDCGALCFLYVPVSGLILRLFSISPKMCKSTLAAFPIMYYNRLRHDCGTMMIRLFHVKQKTHGSDPMRHVSKRHFVLPIAAALTFALSVPVASVDGAGKQDLVPPAVYDLVNRGLSGEVKIGRAHV